MSKINDNKHKGSSFSDHMAETIEEQAELIERLRSALQDIIRHSQEPFLGPKWAYYIREVAEEALK